MTEVENFISSHSGDQKEVMDYLHNLLMEQPGVYSKISYGIPFYYRKSWLCYLNPIKSGNVEFAFTRGNELSNEQGLLQAKGRKQVMGVEFATVKEIHETTMQEVLQEALLLDEKVPYSVKKK